MSGAKSFCLFFFHYAKNERKDACVCVCVREVARVACSVTNVKDCIMNSAT